MAQLGGTTDAVAQDAPPAQQASVQAPLAQAAPVQSPPPAHAAPANDVTELSEAPRPRKHQYSVWVEVPIFIDVPSDVVRPGGGMSARFGRVIGEIFVPGGGLGYTGNPVDFDELDTVSGPVPTGREPLNHFWMNIGLQIQKPVGDFVPYFTADFDFNFWHLLETGYTCSAWYCYGYNRYRFTPGMTLRAGTQYRLREDGSLLLDAGLKYGFTGPGDFFAESEHWFAPYAGITLRR